MRAAPARLSTPRARRATTTSASTSCTGCRASPSTRGRRMSSASSPGTRITWPPTRWRAAVDAGTLPVETSERLTPRQRLAERLILGLRTSDGVPAAWLAERTASEPALARRIDEWEQAGHLVTDGARVRLTESGFILSDALFVDLL